MGIGLSLAYQGYWLGRGGIDRAEVAAVFVEDLDPGRVRFHFEFVQLFVDLADALQKVFGTVHSCDLKEDGGFGFVDAGSRSMPRCRITPRITRRTSSYYADGLALWYTVAVFRRGVLAEKSKQLEGTDSQNE